MLLVIRGNRGIIEIIENSDNLEKDEFDNSPLLLIAILCQSKMSEYFKREDVEKYREIIEYLINIPGLIDEPNKFGLTPRKVIQG